MKNLILLDRVYFKIPAVNIKISMFWLKGKINKNLFEVEGRIFLSFKRVQAKRGCRKATDDTKFENKRSIFAYRNMSLVYLNQH